MITKKQYRESLATNIITLILFYGFTYLLFSFIFWNRNIMEWTYSGLVVFSILLIIWNCMFVKRIYHLNKVYRYGKTKMAEQGADDKE